MWHFGTWFSRHGAGVTAGLDDLRAFFQPMNLRFYDSFHHSMLWSC